MGRPHTGRMAGAQGGEKRSLLSSAVSRSLPRRINLAAASLRPHRAQTQLLDQHTIAVAFGIGRGEELRPIKDRIGAGKKPERLRPSAHVLTPRRPPPPPPPHPP